MPAESVFRGVWLRTLWKEIEPPELVDNPPSCLEAKRTEDGMIVVDEVPADSEQLLKGFAVWAQSPPLSVGSAKPSKAPFADIRCVPRVAGKFGQRRWFAGSLEVSDVTAEEQQLMTQLFLKGVGQEMSLKIAESCGKGFSVPSCRLTWHRDIDSLPESCPSGVDSAVCFLVPPTGWIVNRLNKGSSQFSFDWEDLDVVPENVNHVDGGRWKIVEAGDGYWEEWERVALWPHARTPAANLTETSVFDSRIDIDPLTGKLETFDLCFSDPHSGFERLLGCPVVGRMIVSRTERAVVNINFVDPALVDNAAKK